MHTDEAVNAYIVGQVLAGEPFIYDSQDRHGPALAALALPLARMQGARTFADLTESELRLNRSLAGTVTILLFGAAVEMFGFVPMSDRCASVRRRPLTVYYDRYFIHESLFCAATLGLILSRLARMATRSRELLRRDGRRMRRAHARLQGDRDPSLLRPGSCGICVPRKKSAWQPRSPVDSPRGTRGGNRTFLTLLVILFTWFGRNGNVLPALLRALPDVLARAGGQGHEKPFWYYGRLLTGGWSGGLLFALACAGFLISIRKRNASPFAFLSYYAFLIVAIYSVIPTKHHGWR